MSTTKKLSNITKKQIADKGVQALANRPNAPSQYGVSGLSPTQLKLWFDNLATFLADKVNEIQNAISADDAAAYIRILLDDYGVENLDDLVKSFRNGSFAEKILQVYPSASESGTIPLQTAINHIAQSLSKDAEKLGSLEKAVAPIDELRKDVDMVDYKCDLMWGDYDAGSSIRGVAEDVTDNRLSAHNASYQAHPNLFTRIMKVYDDLNTLTARVNTIADSDDETLDQMSEQVAYIKANRDLIELVTTAKVSVADVVDSLYSSEVKKPLSAAQGAELRRLIEAVNDTKLDTTRLTDAINTALHSAKESGEFGSDPAWTIRAAGEVVVPTSAWTEQNYAFVTLPGEEANKIEEGDLVLLFPSDSSTRSTCGICHVHVESANAQNDSVFLFQCDFAKDLHVSTPLTFNYRVLSCAKPLMRTAVEIVGVNYGEVYRTHLDELEEQIVGLSKLLAGDGDGGMSIREIAEEVVEDHDSSELAHADIRKLIETLAANVYDKAAVERLVSLIPKLTIEPVEALPELADASLTAFYLMPSGEGESDVYTEWFCVEKDGVRAWERLGTQKMDLSGYATTEAMNAAIANAIADALVGYVTGVEVDGKISKALSDYVDTSALQTALTEALKSYAKTTAIPTKLSQLEADATHRTVTDAEKEAWNGKAPGNHTHDGLYQPKGNYQPAGNYAAEGHTHDAKYQEKGNYANATHNHDDLYARRDDIPAYWETHLAEKIAAIKALQDEGGKDAFSFVVLSDMHYSQNLGKRSPTIAKRIMDECGIRFALALGDYQSRGSWSSRASAVGELEDARAMLSPLAGRLLVQQGNHDGSWGDTLNGVTYPYNLTPSELYNRVHALTYAHVDAVTDESGTGYYVDDKARKVRYIMLNSQCNNYETEANGSAKFNNMRVFRFTQSQYDFLVNEALVVEDGWRVIVAAHVPISNAYGELFNGGTAQSAKGDHTLMRGLLTAFRNKTAYANSWDGTAGAGVAYINLADTSKDWKIAYRVNSSKEYVAVTSSDKNNQQITNVMELGGNNKFHIRGMNVYDKKLADGNDYNRVILTNAAGTALGTVQLSSSAWSTYHSVASYDSSVAIIDVAGIIAKSGNTTATHVRFGGYTTDKDAVVITRDEEINDSNVVTGYDAVNIDANFTGYKGELVGYFAGHAHGDNVYSYADWGIPIVTTRCDGASENVSSLLNERVTGTITEQSFDVFTVNAKTRKIYATKIGAGADRVISY